MNLFALGFTVVLTMGLLVLLSVARRCVVHCVPNEICIIRGRESGKEGNYRLLRTGTTFQIPLFETVDRLDTTLMQVEVVEDLELADGEGVTINVDVLASLSRREPGVRAAIERFQGRERHDIEAMIEETVQGGIRAVAAGVSLEELYGDRDRFEMKLSEVAFEGLEPLGVVVHAVHLQRVVGEDVELPEPTPKPEATAANPW